MAKKINIIEKGLKWQNILAPKINHREIAHPVDKVLVNVLEKIHINDLLNTAMEKMVITQYGTMLATGIVLDEKNFPEIYKSLKEIAQLLGINIPYTVISNSMQGINAFATGTDENPFIVISNTAPLVLNPDELKFILAHECGHVAMEHMVYHTAGTLAASMGGYVPVFGPIVSNVAVFPLNYWNRCSEITADRIGFLCCGNLEVSQRALLKIIGGLTDVSEVDIKQYISQSRKFQNMQVLGRLGEYMQSHPMIYKRLLALEYFANSELYFKVTGKTPPTDTKIYTTSQLNDRINEMLSIM